MALFIRKQKSDILREALRKLETKSPITSVTPGSVARAFTEAVTTELGDFYDALDFQVAQSVITSAGGRSLDLIGKLYDVERRTVSEIVTIDRRVGAFFFYIDSPHSSDIVIPSGTKVYSATDSFVGRQLSFTTANDATISVGNTRTFVSITPDFADGSYTAAPGTLRVHSFTSPPGVVVKCTNPKPISPQEGYETDDNYRTRIIKAVRVASGGTYDAIRFSALGTTGVRDVKIQENIYGLGSFRVLVTPEDQNFTTETERSLRDSLNAVRPIGSRMFLAKPDLLTVDVVANVIVNSSARFDEAVLRRSVNIAIKRYLNTLLVGETLVYNRLIQYIMDSFSEIRDVQLTRYAPNGVEALRRNYTPKEEQMIVPGTIGVTIATS